ncbi:hypothetical protein ABZS58_50400, partial [Dactylosporangium sp. NPDC005555]
ELRQAAGSLGPGARRRGVRRALSRTFAGAVTVAAALVLAGSAAVGGPPPGWVRVRDADGVVSVAVPPAWAGQVRDAGWNPAVLRLAAGHAPGLVVAPDVATWTDPASTLPGVFVGASDALTTGEPALPEHPAPCVRQPDRATTVAGAPVQVRRWTSCAGRVSYSEAVFTVPRRGYGVYVQIRQVGTADRTDEVLAGLRLAAYP